MLKKTKGGGKNMRASELFRNCLHARYIHTENGGDYALERTGSRLTIYFEGSDGYEDWKNNLDFPARAYRRMGHTVWFAHRGFVRVWKSVEERIAGALSDPGVQEVTVVGYSHGAALSVLCHEYIWYHRADLRARLTGYGFGCPRVLWGPLPRAVRARWENFRVVRNLDDVVTHLPPAWLLYRHVGAMWEIGEVGRYTAKDAHRPENLMRELLAWERTQDSKNSRRQQEKMVGSIYDER